MIKMLSKNLQKEVIKMAIGVFALFTVMLLVFTLLKQFNYTVLWGGLLGSIVCIFNYAYLAFSLQKSMDKSGKAASGYIGFSYLVRMTIVGITVFFAIKNDNFNYIATAIPFIFPRIVIMFCNLIPKNNKKKRGDAHEGAGNII